MSHNKTNEFALNTVINKLTILVLVEFVCTKFE